ncbi:MAG TPA: DUF2177 family protein [Acidimicrobiia bacterium]|nr:DUF2177 family protein [Acidimicrobiia bacterium]
MPRTLSLFLIALPVFLVIDLIWLGVVARRFYRDQLGGLLRTDTVWPAAIAFYVLFVLGLVVFVLNPAIDDGSLGRAIGLGALFGLITYATYDLTNLATLRDWPPLMTAVDLVWGTVLAASVSSTTFGIADALGV